jgi:nucleoside-diphosphate-sugar epimerase
MRALVTGAAGFIGSRLSEMLVDEGWSVVGIDCFTDYYARELKESNLRRLRVEPDFVLLEKDVGALHTTELTELIGDVDVVFHQAAQAGVRHSWGQGFASYVRHNIAATQHLLEASLHGEAQRFVFASSSSVYGNALRYPTREQDPTRPHSPYGVTKLAGENLVNAYAGNFGLSTVALRYHTVYGPRQRPDMAIHRLIRAALGGPKFTLFAAADFVRDFTFVEDICRANIISATADVPSGTILNLAGGESTTMRAIIDRVGELMGAPVPLEHMPGQAGDVRVTGADWSAAERLLDWRPLVKLDEGLRSQIDWQRSAAASERWDGRPA